MSRMDFILRPTVRKLGTWSVLLGLPICGAAVLALAGCDRAGGALETARVSAAASSRQEPAATPEAAPEADEQEAAAPEASNEPELIARLERLRKAGQFEAFIDATLNAAQEQADNGPLQMLATEALLAAGSNQAAEASALGAAALVADDAATCGQALKLWATARFRQQKPLDDPQFVALLAKLPADEPAAQTLRFWQASLGGRTAFRLTAAAGAGPVEIPATHAAPGSVPAELNAVEARANGVALPLVFIDTGAQHTLLTVAAARAAGVAIGSAATHLVGFARLNARPATIETLELGGLTLHDVPVLVGDSAPLEALQGQMSLGTELMHHVRFTIDYPSRRVLAEAANIRHAEPSTPIWEIPVWTFSQACLARGQLAGGAMARVLVDTGDRAGTFVSARWARRHLPNFQRSTSSLVFKVKPRNLSLDVLELGNQSLQDWPVSDTIPKNLERLDLVDVLLGHDVLGPYQLTIDLPQRVLQLRAGGEGFHDQP
jgi:hypothetical protein